MNLSPKQPRLFPARGKQPKLSQAVAYDTRNRECAALILAHVARYGGEEAGLVKWARAVSKTPISAPEGRKDTN